MIKSNVYFSKFTTPDQLPRKIGLPFFLEEFFLNNLKYKKKINLADKIKLKIFNNKFFRKLILLIILLKRVSLHFKKPKKNKIIIFDCTNYIDIKKVIKEKNFFLLSNRVERIKDIYVCKKILTFMIKNFFKRSIKLNYLIALIKIISPKIVITKIDNSKDFYEVSRELHKKIKFIAIQNAHRGDTLFAPIKETKRIFIPYYLCFSPYEEKIYKMKKAKVKKFIPIGSIKTSLALNYIKQNKIPKKEKYDICLISEPHVDLNHKDNIKNFVETVGLIAQFTHKLCEEKKLKLIFVGKGTNKIKKNVEKEFYKYFLKTKFKIEYGPRNSWNSYKRIMQSNLIVGHHTSLLREAISLNKKVLCCNFTGSKYLKFPSEGLCQLKKNTYSAFKERAMKILSMSNEKYFLSLKQNKDFIMVPSSHFIKSLRKEITI